MATNNKKLPSPFDSQFNQFFIKSYYSMPPKLLLKLKFLKQYFLGLSEKSIIPDFNDYKTKPWLHWDGANLIQKSPW